MFREDKRHGQGKFTWPDGAEYEGYVLGCARGLYNSISRPCACLSLSSSEFRNGQREGTGIYKFSDGGRYEGSWRDGRYSGFGICSWEDGRCYKGYVLVVQSIY